MKNQSDAADIVNVKVDDTAEWPANLTHMYAMGLNSVVD